MCFTCAVKVKNKLLIFSNLFCNRSRKDIPSILRDSKAIGNVVFELSQLTGGARMDRRRNCGGWKKLSKQILDHIEINEQLANISQDSANSAAASSTPVSTENNTVSIEEKKFLKNPNNATHLKTLYLSQISLSASALIRRKNPW